MNNNMKNKKIKDWYLTKFNGLESELNGQSGSEFLRLRKKAINKFEKINFPTLKDEEWKYTNISPILKYNFNLPYEIEKSEINSEWLNKNIFSGFDSHLLVFVNGEYREELSSIKDLPADIIIDSLKNVIKNKPDVILDYFNRFDTIDNSFIALNSAYAYDGAVVIVPDGKVVELPVQILYITGSESSPVMASPKNMFIAGENSRVKIITNFRGFGDLPYFTNCNTDVFAGSNSIVDLYKIESEDDRNGYHIERTQTHLLERSVLSHFSFNFGGKLVRNDLKSTIDGENVECNYSGLYLGSDDQHIDNHTFVDHAKPNSVSNELYKGILEDSSHGVFSGKILVRQEAQKTNAYQSNKTILLSESANIDTKPQLEIYADDVKCSHGATVGHLDDTAYFYIRSRGIPDTLAKSMLIRAFIDDVVRKINIESLKEDINHIIFKQLHRVEI